MHKLWTLLKLNFRVMLKAFSFGSSKKRAGSGIGAVIFLAVLALYISGVYSFMYAQILQKSGMLSYLFPIMAAMACLMSLCFTMFAASGLVFKGKDNDIMLALPVPAFFVMLSKILALYLENLVFNFFWMVPAGIVYLAFGGSRPGTHMAGLVISLLFLPLLPSLLALLGGWLIALVSSRMRHKTMAANLVGFALIVLLVIGALQINTLGGMILGSREALDGVLSSWGFLLGWFMHGLEGELVAMAGFILACLLPFLLITWLLSLQYKRILTGLESHIVKNDYKLRELKMNGQFKAIFRKEWGRYFGSPIYTMNTGIGIVLLFVGCIYLLFARKQAALMTFYLGEQVVPVMALALSFIFCMTNTACVSLSLEGKTLWILKEAPVPYRTLFGAKLLLNAILIGGGGIFSLALLAAAFRLTPGSVLSLGLLILVMAAFIPLFGLTVNLLLPKMDCANDTIVVKQSASSFVGIFGGMLIVGAGVLLYVLVKGLLGFDGFVLVVCLILGGGSLGLWRFINTRGVQILLSL